MNKLADSRRAAIVKCLAEGSSVRSTARMTGTAKATVLKLLVELGEFYSVYQDHVLRNLPCTRVEADEIWAFCGSKARNATPAGQGDIWTFTALCSTTRLMVSWLVGAKSQENTTAFMQDVAGRLTNRIQLTTDGNAMYLTAVRRAFDFGWADIDLVPTSYVERANLGMRTGMRRFIRLTNAFSKKAENHTHAVSLSFMYYNFCQPHGTLTKAHPNHYPTTPAMAAGVTYHVWKMEEIVALLNPARQIT